MDNTENLATLCTQDEDNTENLATLCTQDEDNPENLATLCTQDTKRRQTKQNHNTICVANVYI